MREGVLVLDVGTSKAHASIVDISDGSLIHGAAAGYPWSHPAPGQTEIDPESIWEAIQLACEKALSGLENTELRALAFSWFGANIIPCKADGEALSKLIVSFDARAAGEAEHLRSVLPRETVDKIIRTGLSPDANPSKILWLKNNRSDLFCRTERFYTIQQYIIHRLGLGEISDDTVAITMQLIDIASGEYMPELLSAIGAEREKFCGRVVDADAVLGEIVSLGRVPLPSKLPVIIGGHDCICAQLALGALPGNNVMTEIAGTFDIIAYHSLGYVQTAIKAYGKNVFSVMEGGPVGSGVGWFSDVFLSGRKSLDRLFQEADFSGEKGLVLSGNIQDSTGVLRGLGLHTTAEDMFRAVVEGVTFEIKRGLLNLEALNNGRPFDSVRIGGGGARSDSWTQLRADIYGLPVEKVKNQEASSVGAAILAAVKLGLHPGLMQAQKAMNATEKTFYPRSAVAKRYDERYAEWLTGR